MPAAIIWTPEMLEAFEDGIFEGIPIADICRKLNIGEASFYRRRYQDAEFDTTIVRAQEAAQDANIDRTEAMAKTATAENWQVVQFQCRNAQWVAGKRKAKKYGDKLEHSGPGGGAIQIISSIPRPPKDDQEAS
jgi:hypothetical protein